MPEDVAAAPSIRNAPWIGEFKVEDGDSVFFILFVERKVLCTVNSLQSHCLCGFLCSI